MRPPWRAGSSTCLSPLITVEESDLREGLQLFQIHDRLGSFDAVLAAAALRRDQLTGLASADAAFSSVTGSHTTIRVTRRFST